MGKKAAPRPKAPRPVAQAKSAIRAAWMRSRERGAALKRDGYRCQGCGVKKSTAKGREVKVIVHHIDGVRWQGTFHEAAGDMFCDPSRLMTLCPDCHEKEHHEH